MTAKDAGRPQGRRRLHVVFLNWRDTTNPEGGGSERYVESVARALVEAGHRVTVLCAAHGRAPREEVRDGVRFIRRGNKLGVYPAAAWQLLTRRLGPYDVVVDVQNGVPFLSPLVTRKPVVVLVHHVHREQWSVVYGRSVAAIGWWIESRLAPAVYRRCQYVAVSEATRSELAGLGVDPERIAVVHNGTEAVPETAPTPVRPNSMVFVGRLVPHKRLEHALGSVAALRDELPDIQLTVIGDGWWAEHLHERARELGVEDRVDFRGFVDDLTKHQALAGSELHVMPSLKEGWGISAMEAASHGLPTVAYRSAGGIAESVVDGMTGTLVADDPAAFTAAVRAHLKDPGMRRRLGEAARLRAATFTWEQTAKSFAVVLHDAVTGHRPRGEVDPRPDQPSDDLGVDRVEVEPVRLEGHQAG